MTRIAVNLKQLIKVYGWKGLLPIPAVAVLLAGAIYGEYWLAHLSVPVNVEKSTERFTPQPAARAQHEELIIDNPSLEPTDQPSIFPKKLLPHDDNRKGFSLAVHFDSARLSDDDVNELRRQKRPLPPEGPQTIDYTTEVPSTSPSEPTPTPDLNVTPCRASIDVALADNKKLPSELHLYQPPPEPGATDRTLAIKAVGADLLIQLSITDPSGTFRGAGCRKVISVGDDWDFKVPGDHKVPGDQQLNVVVSANTNLQIWFSPLPKQSPWPDENSSFEPFNLLDSALRARAVRRITNGASPSPTPAFMATSVDGEPQLLVKRLVVGSHDLQLAFGGQAMVQENGTYAETFDLLAFAKKNPLIAGLLAMLDAALLDAFRRVVFRPWRAKPKKRKTEKAAKKKPRKPSNHQ